MFTVYDLKYSNNSAKSNMHVNGELLLVVHRVTSPDARTFQSLSAVYVVSVLC